MSHEKKGDLDITKVDDLVKNPIAVESEEWEEDLDGDNATTIHKNASVEIDALAAMSGDHAATLVAMSGVDIGKSYNLDKSTMVIGRHSAADIRIDDDSVSRKHATITQLKDNSYVLKDLGSTNGTFVDQLQIQQHELEEGDRIIFGHRAIFKVVFQDTLDRSYQHALYFSSVRDPLTKVFNRKYIDDKLNKDLSYSRRHKTPISLLLLDIDFFKKINDNYSHQTGDSTLKLVTNTIGQFVRTEDTVGRYGGEEFVVVAPATRLKGALHMAERIRNGIEQQTFKCKEDSTQTFKVTASIGVISLESEESFTADELYSEADKNLYEAKNTGRNRVIGTQI